MVHVISIRWNFETLRIRIYIEKEKKINIVAIYRRPGKTERRNAWNKILEFDRKGGETVLLGDFNNHHTMWNCEDIDDNGMILIESMEEEDMWIINTDTKSRIGGGRRDANLDLIISSRGLINKIR